MYNLIPHQVVDLFNRQPHQMSFSAAALSVDLSGFTALTEVMMEHGRRGAGMLTDALDQVFRPLVAEVYALGGLITRFAGDAFIAVFPVAPDSSLPDLETASRQALRMALYAQVTFARHAGVETPYGTFHIGGKSGLGAGKVHCDIVGVGGQRAFFFYGPAIASCKQAEKLARRGEIVAHAVIYPYIRDWAAVAPGPTDVEGAGFRQTVRATDTPRRRAPPPPDLPPEELQPFVSPELLAWCRSEAPAEFRSIAPVFVSLSLEAGNVFLDTVLQRAAQYGGQIQNIGVNDTGEEAIVVILFGAPVAHEDDPERAAKFLLSLPSSEGRDAWRAGLTYGTAYTGLMGGPERCEYTAIGSVMNLAARMMKRAAWGDAFVSEAISRRPNLRVQGLGVVSYKGFRQPIPTYRLLAVTPGSEPAPFIPQTVGRQAELARLMEAARPIFQHRFAGVAYIYGEAGIGKSHLAAELHRSLQDRGPVTWLIGQADPMLQPAFGPFTYLLKRYFQQSPEHSLRENRDQFTTALERLIGNLEALADPEAGRLAGELWRGRSLLGALIGLHWPGSLYEAMPADLRYRNTIFALKSLILALGCLQPVVLELEDIHLLDQASHETVTTISRDIADVPLLVVATARPADDGGRPAFSLAQGTPIAVLELEHLASTDVHALAEAVLGAPVSSRLVEILLERTAGNPLFVQQYLLYFRESDFLREEVAEDGTVWTIREPVPADMPTSIHGLLLARIDRLPVEVKEVVKSAAVLGIEFDDRVLAHMVESDISREVHLAEREGIWREVG